VGIATGEEGGPQPCGQSFLNMADELGYHGRIFTRDAIHGQCRNALKNKTKQKTPQL
jgi:hypothetical protein